MKLINRKKFDALSAKEKRVVICKDVLKRIKLNLIVPEDGVIINLECCRVSYSESENPRDYINRVGCQACAKGAILSSWIGNFNNVSPDKFMEIAGHGDGMKLAPKELLKFFPKRMLDNIEAVFEGQTYDWHYNQEETRKYVQEFKWNDSVQDIMKYIIENKGDFPLPSKKKK